MRKPGGPRASSAGDDLLAPFARAVGQNIADARDRATPKAIKIGHPANTQVGIPQYRGMFWGQRMLPDGTSTVISFYAPTNADGSPKDDFSHGDSGMVRFSNDTNPGYWIYSGHASPGYETQSGPCLNLPNGEFVMYGSPDYPEEFKYPKTGLNGGKTNPTNPLKNVPISHVPSVAARKATPKRQDQPPGLPSGGDLWQSPQDGETIFRFQGDGSVANAGKWYAQAGPTSGTFVTRLFKSTVSRGQVVYEVEGTNAALNDGCDLASSDNPNSCYGRVLGVALKDRAAGEYGVVQCSGDLPLSHAYPHGTPLYLGQSGALTDTPPTAASNLLMQVVAVAGNPDTGTSTTDSYITIRPGVPLIRSDTVIGVSGTGGSSGGTSTATSFERTAGNASGATINAGAAVNFYPATDGSGNLLIRLADASSSGAGYVVRGVAESAIPNGQTGPTRLLGIQSGYAGLVVGQDYYSDPATPGGITASPTYATGSYYQIVGYALSTTELYFNPQPAIKQ